MVDVIEGKGVEFKGDELQEGLIQVGLRIAKRGEGALFVVGKVEFEPLVNQDVPSFKVLENPKLLESLALMDGVRKKEILLIPRMKLS